jgi:integrase/recombinase XerD
MTQQRPLLQFKPWSAIIPHSGELPADSPYAKDVWDVRELGAQSLNIAQQYSHYKLDFRRIGLPWLNIAAKRFLKYSLATCAITTCGNRVDSLRRFSEFLATQYPALLPAQLNRPVILDYLSFLASYQNRRGGLLSPRTRQADIYSLRLFIDTCLRNGWVDFPPEPLIYAEDLPPRIQTQPRFIPMEVLEQLNQHIEDLPEPYIRMVLVLQEVGMRISELCTLQFDCLTQDAAGDWWLHYYQHKMKKDHTVTVSRELVAVIQAQQHYLRQVLPPDYEYLFCTRGHSPNGKRPKGRAATDFVPVAKPPSSATLNHHLNRLAKRHNICDQSGQIWHFSSHQFRHTVGTTMANRKVPIHIIARYLGHESLRMTQTYAHIHDQTLKEEVAKLQGKVVTISGAVVEANTEVDTGDLQWFKRHVQAQALPNGSCALPAVQKECPHANACLTCTHFRTTAEFLDQHKAQLSQTETLIEKAEANGWQRQVEMNRRIAQNLKQMIGTLEAPDASA